MASYNSVTLVGNLTRAPELRSLPKGTSVARVSLAINRRWKNDAGVEQEEVTFVECDAWGKTADTLAKYTAKGSPLLVSGRLKLDQWADKTTGEKRSQLRVVIEQFQFLGPAPNRPAGADAAPAQRPAAPRKATLADGDAPEDDVPF